MQYVVLARKATQTDTTVVIMQTIFLSVLLYYYCIEYQVLY